MTNAANNTASTSNAPKMNPLIGKVVWMRANEIHKGANAGQMFVNAIVHKRTRRGRIQSIKVAIGGGKPNALASQVEVGKTLSVLGYFDHEATDKLTVFNAVRAYEPKAAA